MGFYGNITNVNKTQFSFDRTYPSRRYMEENMYKDGVYLGRFVLVEYSAGSDTSYTTDAYLKIEVEKTDIEGYYYGYPIGSKNEKDRRLKRLIEAEDGIITGDVSEKQLTLLPEDTTNASIGPFEFYQSLSADDYQKEEIQWLLTKDNSKDCALFKFVTRSSNDPYVLNYNLDMAKYGEGRGFDSTVWQKVYIGDKEKYVMIAELNSVVPTFAIREDAPTMEPLTPHFDADSTNVYYKLHVQPQWGLRVAKKEDAISDGTTKWLRETYNPETDTKQKEYYNGTEWVPYNNANEIKEIEAAIYYNAAAFKDQVDPNRTSADGIDKHAAAGQDENIISILPTGKSGKKYANHDGKDGSAEAEDIQEIRISLPAIGNMMSDAWDIIHGPNRNDDMRQYDENNQKVSSLKGRLNSFDAMNSNEIPVKRAADGRLIGSKINGGNWNESTDNLKELLSNSFDADDAWIRTTINTTTEPKGEGGPSENAIAIHHTFHSTPSSTSFANVNDETWEEKENYKQNDLATSNDPENEGYNKDQLNLYVPYVDAAGHVVGNNIETVTLPYSYRTFTTDGFSNESDRDLYTNIIAGSETKAETDEKVKEDKDFSNITIASETQDSLILNPGNKWIQVGINDDNFIVTHEIHGIDKRTRKDDLNVYVKDESNIKGDEITVQDLVFDAAGHVIENHPHTYVLPHGFQQLNTPGAVEVNNIDLYSTDVSNVEGVKQESDIEYSYTEIIADNTQDALTIQPVNKWIQVKVEKNEEDNTDVFKIAHEIHSIDRTIKSDDLNNGTDTITFQDLEFDNAGHVIENHKHTYTLPYGYKVIKVENTSDEVVKEAEQTIVAEGQIADNTQDTLTFSASNRWIKLDNSEDDKVKIGHKISNFIGDTTDYTVYGLQQDENHADKNSLDLDNKFEVPCFQFDEAGHIVEARTHKVTLPETFTKFTITGTNTDEVIDTKSNTGSITPDTMTDEIFISSGNKWIQMTTNEDNNSFTIQHYLKKFTQGTTTIDWNKAGDEKTFKVQNFGWDNAGHVTSSTETTYTMPDNFKTLSILNDGVNKDGSGENDFAAAGTGDMVADGLVDKATFNTGNRWIYFTTDTNNDATVLRHAAAATTNNTTTVITNQETSPKFGSTFEVPRFSYDKAGHVSNDTSYTIKFPKGSLTDADFNNANVVTHLSFDAETGTLSSTKTNIGDLIITGYSESENEEEVKVTDTLNVALGKLQKQIHDEETARAAAINGLDVAKIEAGPHEVISAVEEVDGKISAYTKSANGLVLTGYSLGTDKGDIAAIDTIGSAFSKVQNQINDNKNAIALLDENLTTEQIDSIKELVLWTEEHGTDFNEEVKAREGADTKLQDNIDAEANARIEADVKLQEAIDNEVSERKALENYINGYNFMVGDTPQTIKTAIDALDSRCDNSDMVLKQLMAQIAVLNETIAELQEKVRVLEENNIVE